MPIIPYSVEIERSWRYITRLTVETNKCTIINVVEYGYF